MQVITVVPAAKASLTTTALNSLANDTYVVARLITFDSTHSNGLVWGSLTIIVKS